MTWCIATATAQGSRAEQQDRLATYTADNNRHLLVLADGMGGHKGGALAAQTVIDVAERFWNSRQTDLTEPTVFLQDLCQQAHAEILFAGKQTQQRPHSTCVVLYLDNNHASWTHIGDSRLYHFAGKKLIVRTEDHSVVQMLLKLGEITAAEMKNHPDRNQVLKSLGGSRSVETDVHQTSVTDRAGFVLCSDGFWETIGAEEMGHALLAKDLAKAATELVELAVKRGGKGGDNVAVVLARVAAQQGLIGRIIKYFKG